MRQLQLWLRPLGAAESRCLPPGQEDGLPEGDMLQPAARRHFHAKLLLAVWLSTADEVLRRAIALAQYEPLTRALEQHCAQASEGVLAEAQAPVSYTHLRAHETDS